jgi:hypothetical protein
MQTQTITPEDLRVFKTELVCELKELLKEYPPVRKKWIKTYQVIDMLGLSAGTLQTMRSKGRIPYTKIGGSILYDYEDIVKMMEANKQA